MSSPHSKPFTLKIFKERDDLFQSDVYPKPFAFNQDVAAVFDDMVLRSVPYYAEVNRLTGLWAERFYRPRTAIYDLGCSTGTTLEYIGRTLQESAKLVGIDSSESMVATARAKLSLLAPKHEVRLLCEDVTRADIANASVVIMNYTLQFIPAGRRRDVLKTIAAGLVPGGILVMSEKLRSNGPEIQETLTFIYESFKAEQGYTRTEIARKKEALENVLVPFTEMELRGHLAEAGFAAVESIIKWNNFCSFVAQKN